MAVLIGVAATLVGAAGPAQAAACPAGTGVTVVVGSSVGCDPSASSPAAKNFSKTGHTLSYASNSPGFVCRVDGYPASDPCTDTSPADAYWGLFVSDGTSGKWTYSSRGATSLKVPAGGWVAFVFQSSTTKKYPSVKPLAAKPAPRPTTTKPKPEATKLAATPSPTATPSEKGTEAEPDDEDSERTEATATPSAGVASAPVTDDVEATSADDDGASSGLLWAAAVLVAGMIGAGAVIVRNRRSRTGS